MKPGLWTLHVQFKYWQRARVRMCEARSREEGHAVFLCESGTKRGHAVVRSWVFVRAWGRHACAEVIYSALTYSCRWSALCSKLHTPKGIECVSQLTFRVGKHTDEKGWGYSGALSLRRSPRHTLTSLQFQPQCLLTKLCIFTVCVCVSAIVLLKFYNGCRAPSHAECNIVP